MWKTLNFQVVKSENEKVVESNGLLEWHLNAILLYTLLIHWVILLTQGKTKPKHSRHRLFNPNPGQTLSHHIRQPLQP